MSEPFQPKCHKLVGKYWNMRLLLLLLAISFSFTALAQDYIGHPKKDYVVTIETPKGEMVLVLYDLTPKHKANFIKLIEEGFYDGVLFHRVITDFMIQGGDPDSRKARPEQLLGNGDVGYRIDAEFHPDLFHKAGALAAARDNNPEKASSGCQFYIVEGRQRTEQELVQLERQKDYSYPESHRSHYISEGGVPHLDQDYTVFGELLEGLDVVHKIAMEDTDDFDRPKEDIPMEVTVKVKRKKWIERKYGFVQPE